MTASGVWRSSRSIKADDSKSRELLAELRQMGLLCL